MRHRDGMLHTHDTVTERVDQRDEMCNDEDMTNRTASPAATKQAQELISEIKVHRNGLKSLLGANHPAVAMAEDLLEAARRNYGLVLAGDNYDRLTGKR